MKLIGYLSLGYPNFEKTLDVVKTYVENGVDVLEIDFPAKNPFLDSKFIQERMLKALENCSEYDQYMKVILDIRKKYPKQEIFILSYEKTILEIGIEKFINFMNTAEIENLIYVGGSDLEIKNKLIQNNIKLASYVPHHLPEKELKESLSSNGFIYLQAKSDKKHAKYTTLKSVIEYIRNNEGKNKDILCGVGISTAYDVVLAKQAGADGVFIGSTFLKLHDDKEKLIEKIKEFKRASL